MSQKIPYYYALPVIVISTLLVAVIVLGWTEPSVAPPGGNVPAPLNVGITGQSKIGGLILNTGGAPTGLIVQSGNVGIGTTAPIGKLHVSGGNLIVGTGMINGVLIMSYTSSHGMILPVDSNGPTDLWLQTRNILIGGSVFSVPAYKLEIKASDLGGVAGNTVNWEKISGASFNNDQLRIFHNRYATGSSWTSAEIKIQKTVDTTDMHYISFKGLSDGTSALTFGYGTTGQMVILQNGNVGIGISNPQTRLAVVGLTGTTSGVTMRYATDDTGRIYYYASSERYKSDIQPFTDDFYKILNIEPKSFIDNVTGQRNIGYIAEDLDALGLKNLVGYKDGQPETIEYNSIILYLLEVVKDQQKQINELKGVIGQ